MTALQKTFLGIGFLAVAGAGFFQVRQNSQLRDQLQTLHQDQIALTDRIGNLEKRHVETKQQITALQNRPQPRGIRSGNSTNAAANVTKVAVALPPGELESEIDRAYAETSLADREEALDNLGKNISLADTPRALAYLVTRPGMNGVDSPLFAVLSEKWGASSSNTAAAWAGGLADPATQKAAVVGVLKGWTHSSPESAATYAATLPSGDLQDAAVMMVVKEWSFRDPRAAAKWVTAFPPGPLRDKAADPIIFWGGGQCAAAIAELISTSPDLMQKHGEDVGRIWLNRDEPAARIWIQQSTLSDEVKQRLLNQASGKD